jgi:hypothetical protein
MKKQKPTNHRRATRDPRWDAGDESVLWHIAIVVILAGLAIAALIVVVGCSEVTMSPGYAKDVERAAITVAELNRRCQAGDDEACRLGLAGASETLQLIVDALHGESSERSDPNVVN